MHFILNLLLVFSLLFNAGYAVSDDVQQWVLIGPGDADQVTSLSVLPGGTVFVGTDVGGLYSSTDEGNQWKARNTGLDNYDITTKVIQHPADPKILFLQGTLLLLKNIQLHILYCFLIQGPVVPSV